jgi:hypothetical protein
MSASPVEAIYKILVPCIARVKIPFWHHATVFQGQRNNENFPKKTYLHSLVLCFSGSAQDQLMFKVYIESPLLGLGHSNCIGWLLS